MVCIVLPIHFYMVPLGISFLVPEKGAVFLELYF